ncbi:MAG TPA: hypothetical protein VF463_15105 [Sphingobium sp.]
MNDAFEKNSLPILGFWKLIIAQQWKALMRQPRASAIGKCDAMRCDAMRCELVALQSVRNAIIRIVETNDDRFGRNAAHEDLKTSMRADLKITR